MVVIDRELNATGQQKNATAQESTLQPSIDIKNYIGLAIVRFLKLLLALKMALVLKLVLVLKMVLTLVLAVALASPQASWH
jgi:hypothetical protein